MKNKIKSLSKKIRKNSSSENSSQLAKVTNNTLEAERKEILNKGRKYKYPVQYSKRKLVINTVIIAVIIVVVGVVALWQQLYVAQSSNDLVYRISTVLPLPVANVDGENVLYSDYLADYRANMVLSKKKEGTLELIKDEKARSDAYKKQAMENAIRNAYALKLAKENNISVSGEEIETAFREQRNVNGSEISETAFNKIIEDNYGLSPSEYRRMFIELPLIRQKVMAKIDDAALKLKDQVQAFIKSQGSDFSKIAEKFGDSIEIGASGTVKLSNVDGGRTAVALKLEPGQISDAFVSKSGDGYYFVKLISKNSKELSYEYIKVNFTEFDKRLEQLEKDGKISKYIKIEE